MFFGVEGPRRIRFAPLRSNEASHHMAAMRDDHPGVPLGHYRKDQADVELSCSGCAYRQVIPLESVITRLNARGLDGETIGIRAVARHTRICCPRCGARRWSTRPEYPRRPGSDGLPP